MLNRILQVAGGVFVASTIGMLAWYKTEQLRSSTAPGWPGIALIGISVVTLPFAVAKVARESDAASRRNWAILLAVCVVLVILTAIITGR
jgi:hypothetical protein